MQSGVHLVYHRTNPVQGVGGVAVVAAAAKDLVVVMGKSVVSQGPLRSLKLSLRSTMLMLM